jgi:hypothetical protein
MSCIILRFHAIAVYGLALLDILQTVMVTADAFHWFVYGFGNSLQLDEPFLNSWDIPVIDSIISLIVQAFYCWRIYILRKGVVIPVLILLVSPSLLRFVEGLQNLPGFASPIRCGDRHRC